MHDFLLAEAAQSITEARDATVIVGSLTVAVCAGIATILKVILPAIRRKSPEAREAREVPLILKAVLTEIPQAWSDRVTRLEKDHSELKDFIEGKFDDQNKTLNEMQQNLAVLVDAHKTQNRGGHHT